MVSPAWFRCFPLLLLLAHGKGQSDVEVDVTGDELAALYQNALQQYTAFPPLDPDPEIYTNSSTVPIDVVAGQVVLSIDDISPGSSEFTVTTRTVIYWPKNSCNQTIAHEFACNEKQVSGFRFFTQENVNTPTQVLLDISQENIHSKFFEDAQQEELIPDAELVEGRTTYKQAFDMRYYPYEVHELKVSLSSLYSSNIVKISRFPNYDTGIITPKVPSGWTYIGNQCQTFFRNTDSGRVITDISLEGDQINFEVYSCSIYVSRTNPGWWITSFLLFFGLILISFLGSVGVMSHMVAEARDDRDAARASLFDGSRLIGTFTVGILLTYVFQVEISPYGQPVEFWPRIPTSTMIYCLGLVGIFTQSFAGLIGSLFFTVHLTADGFVGKLMGPYDLEKVPKEGEVGEDKGPLLLKRREHSKTEEESEPKEEDQDLNKKDVEQVEDPSMKIQKTRQANTKRYNVLSVEEAMYINQYVKNIFFFKAALLFTLILSAVIIVSMARGNYKKDIDQVVEGLKNNAWWTNSS